jgi:hypothetical protein
MFKKIIRQKKILLILPHLKSQDSRIPGFGILFKNSNSGGCRGGGGAAMVGALDHHVKETAK